VRWLLWQVWDPQGETYKMTFYVVEDRGAEECRTHVMRSTYYAIGIDHFIELMERAGFERIRRYDDRYFQPMLGGTRAAE
ncbi:MAG TPA: hypothetical protein PLA80_12310, partial [Synergistaceae bacterium]|nr:hypothetical protein [Synergistaceae bacterium]